MLCRQFNLESPTLDNAIASCYFDSKGGGNIQYEPLIEMLLKEDYADLFNADNNTNNQKNGPIFMGRSSLRARQDGAAGSLRIRPVPVDEWAVLTKNNNDVANAYEQRMAESKRREVEQYGQQLKSFAQEKRDQQIRMKEQQKIFEKQEEDRKFAEYEEIQRQKEERQAAFELAAWEEGQSQIRTKQQRATDEKNREMMEAKARVQKNNQDAENEYMRGIDKKNQERREWRASLQHNVLEQRKKEKMLEQERIDDKVRQEEYAKMLEKEVSVIRERLFKMFFIFISFFSFFSSFFNSHSLLTRFFCFLYTACCKNEST
jgi:hypothetical protein